MTLAYHRGLSSELQTNAALSNGIEIAGMHEIEENELLLVSE
jgi:hypothetical protein